jgi:cytochrome c oxidase subunit IV
MNREPSTKANVAVFLALMVLLGLSVGASFVDLGAANLAVALGISVAKAALVLLFFMHLLYSPRLVPVIAISGLVWLGILLAITFADYTTRARPADLPPLSSPAAPPPPTESLAVGCPTGFDIGGCGNCRRPFDFTAHLPSPHDSTLGRECFT